MPSQLTACWNTSNTAFDGVLLLGTVSASVAVERIPFGNMRARWGTMPAAVLLRLKSVLAASGAMNTLGRMVAGMGALVLHLQIRLFAMLCIMLACAIACLAAAASSLRLMSGRCAMA